jgi:TPR repeat protein
MIFFDSLRGANALHSQAMTSLLARCLCLGVAATLACLAARAQEMQAAEEAIQFLKTATITWAFEKVLDKAASIALPKTSAEEDFNRGMTLLDGVDGSLPDRQRALDWFHQSAEKGYTQAQDIVGDSARDAKKYSQALYWYEKSAAQSDPHGLYQAAAIYWLAEDVQRNDTRSITYLKRAADLGDRDSESLFGSFLFNGDRMQRDPVQAAYYFEKAANQGDANAEQAYGLCFATNQGRPRDLQAAYFWFHAAAEKGEAMGEYNLGAMLQNGDAGMTDNCQARYWFRKSSEQGNSLAADALTKTPKASSCPY